MNGALKHLLLFLCLSLAAYGFGQQPVANFSANVQAGCVPLIVNFQDLSSGNPTAWKWDLGNGSS
ncbi:MAG TPA: hypothetical protein VFL47_14475, partial [Flavisolibacter sp.]|nr:hypothetical protein [Flavisolibacter sp.]